MTETLCWTCARACGGCPWSAWAGPVEGWEVTEHTKGYQTRIKGEDGKSKSVYVQYTTCSVVNCPLYLRDCNNSLSAISRVEHERVNPLGVRRTA